MIHAISVHKSCINKVSLFINMNWIVLFLFVFFLSTVFPLNFILFYFIISEPLFFKNSSGTKYFLVKT